MEEREVEAYFDPLVEDAELVILRLCQIERVQIRERLDILAGRLLEERAFEREVAELPQTSSSLHAARSVERVVPRRPARKQLADVLGVEDFFLRQGAGRCGL